MKDIEAIDLFCGAGGLTHGLELAGITVNKGYDIDPACQYPYSNNNDSEFVLKSISEITSTECDNWFSRHSVKLLAGCAPCQPFSKYSSTRSTIDEKWSLLNEFSKVVSISSPDIVTMENVPQLRHHSIFKEFLSHLNNEGFSIWYDVIKCEDIGLPQRRKRLVLLASKLGNNLKLSIDSTKKYTVWDAIAHLPKIEGGQPPSQDDPLHISPGLSQINKCRIQASIPGKTWREWPTELLAACHRKASGKNYASVYGRMEWGSPSPTITTQFYGYGNGRFGHPEQDRAISLREGAILQSFPDDYRFLPPGKKASFKETGRLIGNAVPVTLGRKIGEAIIRHIGAL